MTRVILEPGRTLKRLVVVLNIDVGQQQDYTKSCTVVRSDEHFKLQVSIDQTLIKDRPSRQFFTSGEIVPVTVTLVNRIKNSQNDHRSVSCLVIDLSSSVTCLYISEILTFNFISITK